MTSQPPMMKDTDSFSHERWKGVTRPYTEDHVQKLRGHLRVEHTIADYSSRRLWKAMKEKPFVRSLGALTGGQAVQMVRAGLEAIYCSGWQVAADANTAAQTYPDRVALSGRRGAEARHAHQQRPSSRRSDRQRRWCAAP
ncbi:MAG: hypothetical protein U0353_07890 [Sandaracinus sp.]